MDFQVGEPVNIIAGEFAGLGGEVVALYEGGCEVLVGGYRLPASIEDLAPDLRTVAAEALEELRRLHGDSRVIVRLMTALAR